MVTPTPPGRLGAVPYCDAMTCHVRNTLEPETGLLSARAEIVETLTRFSGLIVAKQRDYPREPSKIFAPGHRTSRFLANPISMRTRGLFLTRRLENELKYPKSSLNI